jgi:hypothetical protein
MRHLVLASSTFLFGAAALFLGVLFRSGRARGAVWYYRDKTYPLYVRNGAFSLIPCGVSLLVLSASVALFGIDNDRAALLVGGVALISGLVAIAFVVRPPRFIKPRWLRDDESASAQASRLSEEESVVRP